MASPAEHGWSERNALVFESTGLIHFMKEHKKTVGKPHLCLDLEQLERQGYKVYIPDMVFYEATGILPGLQEKLISIVRAPLADEDGAERTQVNLEAIEQFVRMSPRTSNKQEGDTAPKNHYAEIGQEIRELITYVVKHPDALVSTRAGQLYHASVVGEHAALSPTPTDHFGSYRPTVADLLQLQPTAFERMRNSPLTIHQLFHSGLLNETEYLSLRKGMNGNGALLTTAEFSRRSLMKGHAPELPKGKEFVTPDWLLRHAEQLIEAGDEDAEPSVRKALCNGKLSLRQLFAVGLLPQSRTEEIAQWMLPQLGDHSELTLVKNGFYDIRPSVKELQFIATALGSAETYAPLHAFIAQFHHHQSLQATHLNEQCSRPPNKEVRVPYIGIPYEKVLSEACISGLLPFDSLMQIGRRCGAIHHVSTETSATGNEYTIPGSGVVPGNGVRIRWVPGNAKASEIGIPADGFSSRTGRTTLDVTQGLNMRKERSYQWFSVASLLEQCRENLGGTATQKQKLYRLFETLTYNAVGTNAASVRQTTLKLLNKQYGPKGIDAESMLAQLEKDFSNRHFRKMEKTMQEEGNRGSYFAFPSVLAAMHADRRTQKKDLGEIATLEAAYGISAQNKHPEIHICNDDESLQQHRDTGKFSLAPGIMTSHARLLGALAREGITVPSAEASPDIHMHRYKDMPALHTGERLRVA